MTKNTFFLTLLFTASTTFLFAQTTTPDTTKKEFKNVIGIDATGLLRQFFNFSATSYFNYPYMLSYKRIWKTNALRIGVGGNIYNSDGTTNDSISGKRINNDFNVGIGLEHYAYLGKRWNWHFGADVIMNYRYNDYQSSSTTSSSYRQTITSFGYGVSPLLGLQFKLNSRLSIATETSYDITYTTSKSSSTRTPSSIYDSHTKTIGIQSSFNAPSALNFRIQF